MIETTDKGNTMTQDKRLTVLIVDDLAVNIQLLNEILYADYRVIFATSGTDALALASEATPDIVLLDVIMPGMDGYEVCLKLKQDEILRDIPVIFITAMDQEGDEAKGLELGAVDYIIKPFHSQIVKLRIKNQLELKRQRDLLSRLSNLDGLTGIGNRRSFDDYLEREWRRATRTGGALALLMIDIDFFKNFNDTYGHLAGDESLKAVAGTLQRMLERSGDFVARYGGEEFCCILPETGLEGAEIIAERIASSVRDLKIPHEASPACSCVTVSIGVAATVPTKEKSPLGLVEKADRMLYAAKQGGRNRVASDGSS